MARLRQAGVAAARVAAPADLLTDPQLLARGFWEPVSHPVTGNFLTTGQPFRSAVTGRFPARAGSPTLGQHNEEIRGLEQRQVIGTRPRGW